MKTCGETKRPLLHCICLFSISELFFLGAFSAPRSQPPATRVPRGRIGGPDLG